MIRMHNYSQANQGVDHRCAMGFRQPHYHDLLACRMPHVNQQSAPIAHPINDVNRATSPEADLATPTQNGITTLRGRIGGVDMGVRPSTSLPNGIVQ